jgi:hypothetical protein
MTQNDKFLKLVHASFPAEPLPEQFFWAESRESLEGDIPKELQKRIAHRRWTQIRIIDWAMVGTPPSIARTYLEPPTFLYYLPSLLVGVLDEANYFEFGIEAIIPHNKTHTPRGKWWFSFSACVSEDQRVALCAFL